MLSWREAIIRETIIFSIFLAPAAAGYGEMGLAGEGSASGPVAAVLPCHRSITSLRLHFPACEKEEVASILHIHRNTVQDNLGQHMRLFFNCNILYKYETLSFSVKCTLSDYM